MKTMTNPVEILEMTSPNGRGNPLVYLYTYHGDVIQWLCDSGTEFWFTNASEIHYGNMSQLNRLKVNIENKDVAFQFKLIFPKIVIHE